MDEYASMRFTLRCGMASRFPNSMVRMASQAMTLPKDVLDAPAPAQTARATRVSTAKAAVLTPAAMKAVTGVGAPS